MYFMIHAFVSKNILLHRACFGDVTAVKSDPSGTDGSLLQCFSDCMVFDVSYFHQNHIVKANGPSYIFNSSLICQ